MKPDKLGGGDHPLEFAVIDGLQPGVSLENSPVVRGTRGRTDDEVLDWLASHPGHLPEPAVTALVMRNTLKTAVAVVRFRRCPDCNSWSPCGFRHQRGY